MRHSKVTSREMTVALRERFNKVFAQLEADGFLLMTGSLPNVSSLSAEEKIRGSWWSHDKAHTIFKVAEMLADQPDVMILKLIDGKVTFVHRELWNRIYSIGVAREEWQLNKLSANGRALLKAVDNSGRLQTNKLGQEFGAKPGETARELELRLLIHAEQIHTESGKHAKVIETWDAWAKRIGFRVRAKSPAAARRFLEERLAGLNKQHDASAKLPWPSILPS